MKDHVSPHWILDQCSPFCSNHTPCAQSAWADPLSAHHGRHTTACTQGVHYACTRRISLCLAAAWMFNVGVFSVLERTTLVDGGDETMGASQAAESKHDGEVAVVSPCVGA